MFIVVYLCIAETEFWCVGSQPFLVNSETNLRTQRWGRVQRKKQTIPDR